MTITTTTTDNEQKSSIEPLAKMSLIKLQRSQFQKTNFTRINRYAMIDIYLHCAEISDENMA